MTNPEPTIRIPVDLTNPGQFFACCGLLELASRMDEHALSWFANGSVFNLSGSIEDLIVGFRNAQYRQVELDDSALRLRNGKTPKDPSTVNPVEITPRGATSLTLDWWLRPHEHNGLKLWSGSNRLIALVEDVFTAIKQRQDDARVLLTTSFQLPRQPFFYAAARPLHEREFGVSMDKIGREFEHLPYVELLALIGLQRFRPSLIARQRFRYFSWAIPIPAEIACAVIAGAVESLSDECFEFPVINRDDKGHKQFTRSERRSHV